MYVFRGRCYSWCCVFGVFSVCCYRFTSSREQKRMRGGAHLNTHDGYATERPKSTMSELTDKIEVSNVLTACGTLLF